MTNTGNKFNDLFELSKKLQPLKQKEDKNAVDYEFEKSRDECSFKPNLTKTLGDENAFTRTMT